MRKFIIAITFILSLPLVSIAQSEFTNLSDALKSPSEIEEITITASTSQATLSQFTSEKDRFQNLFSVRFEGGVNNNVTESVITELRTLGITEVSFSTTNLNSLPKSLITLPQLAIINIESFSNSELDNDNFFEETLLIKIFKGSKVQELEVSYMGDKPLTESSKTIILQSFPNSSYTSSQTKQSSKPQKTSKELNIKVFEKTSPITPLLKSVDVPRSVTKINTDKPNTIKYKSGTVLNIPENAFVDEDGNPVEGDIDISYREMKTPTEILFAGVPMAYDSGGVVNQFQSAGNFEIQAAKDGKPLQLASGKQIDIDFTMADSQDGYNFYKFNAETRNWDYQTVVNKTENTKERLMNRETATQLDESFFLDTSNMRFSFDCTPFEERFNSKYHVFLMDSNSTKKNKWYAYNRGYGGYTVARSYRWIHFSSKSREARVHKKKWLVKLKLKKVERAKKDSLYPVGFTFEQRKISDLNIRLFPELKSIRGVLYTSFLTRNRDFRKEFIRGKKYYDIRVDYTKGDDVCYIHLKDKKGIKTIEVDLAIGRKGKLLTGKKLIRRKKSFYLMYKRYLKRLRKREADFNKRIETRKKQLIERRKQLARASRNRNNANYNSSSQGMIVGSLSVSGLGIYNCDQIRRLSAPIARMRNVTIKSDTVNIAPSIVYVIDKSINGVLSYYGGKRVALNKNNTRVIVAIDAGGDIFYTNSIERKELRKSTLSMNRINKDDIKTADQLNTILGL